jgi:hypothetical protein
VAVHLCGSGGADAQELEPRAYSPSPIGTNFLIANYTRSSGSVSTDAELPISNVQATINIGALGYSRTFGLFGQTASAAILLPYLSGDISGVVGEQAMQVTRSGLGDLRLRFAQSLLGSPALTPGAFERYEQGTSVGSSVTVVAPTGHYNPAHLVNVGSNRWAFKPEIGLSQPIGRWFADAAAGAWLFTDNHNFFNGHVRGQDPLWSFQLHGGYYFERGFWLAADATHYTGGQTSIDGVANHDSQSVSRYGLTLAVPLGEGFSAKLSWASWLKAHNSGSFDTVGLTLQYRWFDR